MNLLKSRAFALVAVLVLALLYVWNQLEIQQDPRPLGTVEDVKKLAERDDLNVLFILIDTLRSDRLGSYGYERDTSPYMDYLADTGARFALHRAQSSWTKCSMASLWTGLNPLRTGVERFADALAEEATTPAEIFKAAGYTTAGIWRNGWLAPNFQFGQGFDMYVNPYRQQAPKSLRREARAGRIDGTDIDLVFSGLEFLRSNTDRKFFLYVHLMDVHQYVTVEELSVFGTSYSDFYDNSILWTDKQVQALIGGLEKLGLREKTLIVIASDHGEAFGEHGREGHARDLHPEVTYTPFILSFPFRLEPGIVVEEASHNVDVWPTLLDLLNLPPLSPVDGRSYVAEMTNDAPGDHPDIGVDFLDRTWGRMSEEPDPILAFREGNLRMVYHVNDPEKSELYDLATDPGEKRPLPIDHPEVERLKQMAADEVARGVAWSAGDAPTVEIDDLSLKQLRALGYEIE
ncbi:MAG: sulfatase [Myxococcota bacterium]